MSVPFLSPVRVPSVTSEPSVSAGDLWYRSDQQAFYMRSASTSDVIATQTYVNSIHIIGRLTSNFVSANSTSIQAVTGTLITVPIGIYVVEFVGFSSAFGGTGNKTFTVTNGGGLVASNAEFYVLRTTGSGTAATVATAVLTDLNNGAASSTGSIITTIKGSLQVTTGGTLNIGLTKATGTDTVTINAGSYFMATKVG